MNQNLTFVGKLGLCLVLFPFMLVAFLLAEPVGWFLDRAWRIFSGERNY